METPNVIQLKKVKMSNGTFSECPTCKGVMSMNMWGTGINWVCFRCGMEIHPKMWIWRNEDGLA